MKKYEIPEIEIKSFLSECVVTASRPYIHEIETLTTNILGETPDQANSRMKKFTEIISYSS